MLEKPPADPADHAQDFARRWADRLELYCIERMQALGVPHNQVGQPDYDGDGRWWAFNPYGRQGGENTTGVVIDSGVLNPDLMKGKKGGRIWPHMRLRDRIDAAIAHEYEELRHGGSHAGGGQGGGEDGTADHRGSPATKPKPSVIYSPPGRISQK